MRLCLIQTVKLFLITGLTSSPKIANNFLLNCNIVKASAFRFEDAAKFIKNYKNQFDVVIVDSSDPVGPANTLFTEEFYSNLQESMTEDGVICCQGECMWLHLDLITSVLAVTRKIFSTVEYAYTSIPSYPSGKILHKKI